MALLRKQQPRDRVPVLLECEALRTHHRRIKILELYSTRGVLCCKEATLKKQPHSRKHERGKHLINQTPLDTRSEAPEQATNGDEQVCSIGFALPNAMNLSNSSRPHSRSQCQWRGEFIS